MSVVDISHFISQAKTDRRRKRLIQWCLAPIVPLTIGLGWKYPLLGYVVPVTMAVGMGGGFSGGRFVCGNLCPRGGLLDRVVSRISPLRTIPAYFRSMRFRWTFFAVMISFMLFQMSRNPTDPFHIGWVFWLMCTLTTGIALVGALFTHPRTWCSFCPVGTFANTVGGDKKRLEYHGDSCTECKACEKACPLALPITDYRSEGVIAHRDCLRCHECVARCPKASLRNAG